MHFYSNNNSCRSYNNSSSIRLLSQSKTITLFILLFLIPSITSAIGLTISPIKNIKSNQKKLSSLKNLQNCLSYEVESNDILFLSINPIENLPSQEINLKIMDSQGNILRNQPNLSKFNKVLEFIINSNNNEVTSESDNELDIRSNTKIENQPKLRNFIHVCFDNLYNDLSWSFQPQDFEIEMDINIKNDIKLTNYKIYKNFFSNINTNTEEGSSSQEQDYNKIQINEEIFDSKMNSISLELNSMVDKLIESDLILQDLLNQEFKLRDVNEEIFSGYNFISVFLCLTIFICGLVQLVFFKCYLKRKNIT
ncbi:hypothetical protein KGF54_001826 [Candida jiufengensis]|uniref:uncharacterized protein n=1 Tax=Candida jiufengensis TaxID=497108 RepID=UPI0022244CE4|nr:uncharacterized protein KGF54_001826 [Candida jiufengensis]KAI5955265.1 hypothetical protein KGF54_001826 [Candida jiufengensis]